MDVSQTMLLTTKKFSMFVIWEEDALRFASSVYKSLTFRLVHKTKYSSNEYNSSTKL